MSQVPTATPQTAPTERLLPMAGFSVSEIAFLLRRAAGVASEQGFAALLIDRQACTPQIAGFGLSSLVARGWATLLDGTHVRLGGPALVLSHCLTEARRWTQIGFFGPDGTDVAVYVQAPSYSVLLQPRRPDTWIALCKPPEQRDAEAIWLTLEAAAYLAPHSSALLSSVTADTAVRLAVRKTEDNRWTYASTSDAAQAPTHNVDSGGLIATLDDVLRLPER